LTLRSARRDYSSRHIVVVARRVFGGLNMVAPAEQRNQRFGGYYKSGRKLPAEDAELTHVGPGTPGGEYLRRFWQPVAMSSELGARPLRLRILGEDLVLFRTRQGTLGLLDLHCSHRGTSLEFGIVTDQGISCCYHGWHYGTDGAILETPAEPPDSPIKQRLCHGAYPVRERSGLIFAYMGPPDVEPKFPLYDAEAVPGNRPLTYSLPFACNWLQVHENGMDPIHSVFLHTRASGTQFAEVFGALPVMTFAETRLGMISTTTRRWGDHVWVRTNDSIAPNLCQFGPFWEDGQAEKYFVPPAISRWIVPHDDTSCMTIGWRHFNDRMDPHGRGNPAEIGKGKVDFMGQTPDRAYPERQDQPGDYDAQVSQRPISVHALEHLGASDVGVAMLRRQLRTGTQAVKSGGRVAEAPRDGAGIIPTFAHDTIIRAPLTNRSDDQAFLRQIGDMVERIVVDSADHPRDLRPAHIEKQIRKGLKDLRA
jgi:phenylpropionate dioxygenase-like ring-hydroxylating dioxygenase large terminal subunit